MNNYNTLRIEVLNPEAVPYKKFATDAGIDLRACIDTEVLTLIPYESYKIDTGIRVAIPEGYCGLVIPRSGMGTAYKLSLDNTVGVIDSDYRGNIYVHITSETGMKLKQYERFAQLVIVPVLTSYNIVDNLESTERGDGGFGHTGRE